MKKGKRTPWLHKPEAVVIKWEDHSITADTEEPYKGTFMQQSVGFLREEGTDKHGNDYVIISQSYDEEDEYADSLTILCKNIVRRKKLK